MEKRQGNGSLCEFVKTIDCKGRLWVPCFPLETVHNRGNNDVGFIANTAARDDVSFGCEKKEKFVLVVNLLCGS